MDVEFLYTKSHLLIYMVHQNSLVYNIEYALKDLEQDQKADAILNFWERLLEKQNCQVKQYPEAQKNIIVVEGPSTTYIVFQGKTTLSFDICVDAIKRVRHELIIFILNFRERRLQEMEWGMS